MPDAFQTPELAAILRQIVGDANVIDDLAARELFSQDVWAKGHTTEVIVRPVTTEQLSQVVSTASARSFSVIPRGGGMSYTNAYTPSSAGSVMIDTTGLNRVIEVNTSDMYVTVEAGCTWADLHAALKPTGLRTPFWGPLSGISSTIGGGLSQNNAFFGAGKYGPTSESVVALTVVLADGSIVRTGSAGTVGAKPFFRHYGPDLTGLFMADAGSLGFKAEATFRLIPAPAHEDWVSWEFTSRDACAAAMADVARSGLACELFGFDPNLQRVRMRRASMASDVKTLAKVVTGQKNILKGAVEGAKIAMAGRNFMDDAGYTLHAVVEGATRAGVSAEMALIKAIGKGHGAKEIENSIPKIIRANPFTPLNNMLGPDGERWVPVHGIVSMGDGPACWSAIEDAFAEMRAELDAHKIMTGYLVTSLSTNGYLIEPVFLWPAEIFPLHEASVEAGWLKKLPRHAPNPEATATVAKARKAVVEVFERFGGAHFQIGKTYPYRARREGSTWALLDAIKTVVDPERKVNPGALGFE
jgi:D-lactate dehydrogenase (cytochrome)